MQRTPAMSGGVSFMRDCAASYASAVPHKRNSTVLRCAALNPQKGAHRKLPNIVREHYYSFSLPPAEHYYSFPPCARLRALSPLCHRQSGTTLASASGGAPYAPQGLEVVSLTLPRLLTLSFGCRTRKRPGMSDGDISMKCKESACGMDRSVLFRT